VSLFRRFFLTGLTFVVLLSLMVAYTYRNLPTISEWTMTSEIVGKFNYAPGRKNVSPIATIGELHIVCSLSAFGGDACAGLGVENGRLVEASVLTVTFRESKALMPISVRTKEGLPEIVWTNLEKDFAYRYLISSLETSVFFATFISFCLDIVYSKFFLPKGK
jgi:hypothetical protein